MKLIQDELEKVVAKVQTELMLDNLTFECSTVNEFLAILANKKTPIAKYPFFFVNAQGIEYHDSRTDVIVSVPDIVIATYSDSKWSRRERDEQSFKPILNRIYEVFEDKLNRDRNLDITTYGKRINHYFYGKTGLNGYEEGIYPDHVDAIQLRNFQFRIKNNCK